MMDLRISLCFGMLSCICSSLSAQVVIGPGDMPQSDDVFPFAITTLMAENEAELTGEDFTWDYSFLLPDINDVDTFVSVTDTPFLFQFYFNNPFLYPDYNADYAKDELDADLGLVVIEDSYSYFKNDTQGLRNVGFGADINGIPSSVRNIPIDWIYEFPLEYGDTHESYSESEIEIPTLGYYFRTQNREVEVDGWGTLILPDAEYEVLKVKMTINGQDSIYLDLLEQGISIPRPEEIRYQWLSPGLIQPVLEISQQVGFGALVRFKSELPSGISEENTLDLKIYPNPCMDYLWLNSSNARIEAYTIFDSNGRLVVRKQLQNTSREQVIVRNFTRGEYVILIEVNGSSYYSSFIKN